MPEVARWLPKWPQDGPGWLQDAQENQTPPSSGKMTTTLGALGLAWLSNVQKAAQDVPGWLQGGSQLAQPDSKMAPRWPSQAPKWLQLASQSKSHQ